MIEEKGSLSSTAIYTGFIPLLFMVAVCHALLKYLEGIFSNIPLCNLEQTFIQLWADAFEIPIWYYLSEVNVGW